MSYPIPKKWDSLTRVNIERVPPNSRRFEILLPNGDIIRDSGDPDIKVKLRLALSKYPKAKGFRVE